MYNTDSNLIIIFGHDEDSWVLTKEINWLKNELHKNCLCYGNVIVSKINDHVVVKQFYI